MAVTISIVTDADLQAVDKLMKMNSNTLGFLPKQALEYHIKRGWMLGAKTARRKTRRISSVCVIL